MRFLPSVACIASVACASPVPDGEAVADVVAVRAVEAGPDRWTFFVSVRSDETGCGRYADWWELDTPDGELVFRRILDHSHPSEQPFERDGGPVAVAADEPLVVRAHLAPGGFRGEAMEGSIEAGFATVELAPGFAPGVEDLPPQPTDCLF